MCHRCEPSAINPNPSCLKNLKYMSFKECPEEKKACYSTETSKSVFVYILYSCLFTFLYFIESKDGHAVRKAGCTSGILVLYVYILNIKKLFS